jgi:LPS export ABC transporter protein LptC
VRRLIFFVAFMTLGTFGLIYLLVEEPGGPGAPPPRAVQAVNVLNMSGVTVNQLVGPRVRWDLRADFAHFNENSHSGELDTVNFRVYGSAPGTEGEVDFAGSSGRAFVSTDPGSVVLVDKVVLHHGAEMEIHSERIEYDAVQELFTSPGPVRVITPQGIQEGSTMRYHVADERVEFSSPLFYQ